MIKFGTTKPEPDNSITFSKLNSLEQNDILSFFTKEIYLIKEIDDKGITFSLIYPSSNPSKGLEQEQRRDF